MGLFDSFCWEGGAEGGGVFRVGSDLICHDTLKVIRKQFAAALATLCIHLCVAERRAILEDFLREPPIASP